LLPPLVVTVSVAVSEPTTAGLNSTGRMQLFFAATAVPQVLPVERTVKSAAPVPEIAVETVIDASVPTFETVTFTVFVVPCVMVPNATDVGDTDASVRAVPESGMTGLEPPLVVSVSVPLLFPIALGSYSIGRTQLAPETREVVHVFPVLEIKKPAPMMDGESVKEAVPVLVTVRFEVADVPK